LRKNNRVSRTVLLSSEPKQLLHTRLLNLGAKLNQLRSAFLSAPIALCLIDQELRYIEVNERMALLNRLPIEAHIGRTLREIIPEIADEVEPVYRQVFATGDPVESRFLAQPFDGDQRYLVVNYNPVKDEGGTTVLVSVAVFDVTAETKARDETHVLARQLQDVLESTSDNVILLSSDWKITYVNQRAERLFAPKCLTVGESLQQFFPDWVESDAGRKLIAISVARNAESFESYFPTLDRWLELDVFPTTDGLSVFFRDISDHRRAEEDERRARERIAYLAKHDSLTGLSNRSFFYDNLDTLLAKMKADAEVVLLYLDLDGFKAVNDTMGHPAGDAILVAVAERLHRSVANSVFISRFGGDEFVVAMAAPESRSAICVLAENMVKSVSESYFVEDQLVSIGVSIGIAIAMRGVTGDELVRQADVALYSAKASGRGCYRFFEPGMGDEVLLRQLRKRELAQALARNQLDVEYQPIVDLKTGDIVAFEALLRWRNPIFDGVSVATLVALAEEIGLICQLGEWVLREACQEAASWPASISLFVNVSVHQIRRRTLGQTVKQTLAETGIAPGRLNLEITETVLLVDERRANETLEDLRQHGVKISLDDFGKGYSSLEYLQKFRVDKIKIDRSFVQGANSDAASLAILRAVVTLAHDLGISTVAEGIELDSHYNLLKRERCDLGQGFFLGRPMSGHECGLLVQQGLADVPPPERIGEN
jgi:diguanylate cyclase (GGDEF)-like protein/PAS domain S-box-containing protein